jgi:aspartyl-tRNA(Asn)/glutamyl-tRNA(Gln) amidotransferase subunit A
VIAGYDDADPGTHDRQVPRYLDGISDGVRGLRIGVVTALLERRVDPEVARAVEDAIAELRGLGASVETADVQFLDAAGSAQQAIQFPEATTVHLEWLRTRLRDYGPDVRARLLAGLFVPATAYVTGQRARRVFCAEIRRVFERFDLLVAPTMPVVAPRIGEDVVELDGEPIPYRLALIRFNSPWSLAGSPVASVPCGFVNGLPVGLALVGRPFAESTVLRAAHAFQSATDWHLRHPELFAAAL